MSKNFEKSSFIQNNLNVPPIGFYKPKYETIEPKSPKVILSRSPVISKKLKLKKLLYEYNVPKEYKLFSDLNE